MEIDVLNLVAPSPQFMASSYLASVTPGENPTITSLSTPDDDGTMQLVYMKGLAGYPWDWMTVTQSWIRQRLTENVWANPATGKLASGLGVRRLPRYIIGGTGTVASSYQWTMTSPETDYLIFNADGTVAKNTDAGVRCTFRGPYVGAAIGMLPAGEDWIEDYEWGGKPNSAGAMIYTTLERITHRKDYGRYQWQSFPSDGQGGYASKPSASSQQTQIVPLPAPVIPVQHVF